MRECHPPRTLHLVDIENLLGTPRPALESVERAREAYESRVRVGQDDLLVVACNHGAAIEVGFAYPGSRLVVRSGNDGADLALLDVLSEHDVRERFDAVVIGSGDGIFTDAAAALAGQGVPVLVVSRPESLARSLRLAVGGRVVPFAMTNTPSTPASALTWARVA